MMYAPVADTPIRARIYEFSASLLVGMCSATSLLKIDRHPMPKDARITGVVFDPLCDRFKVRVESEEFEPLRPGDYVPHAQEPWFSAWYVLDVANDLDRAVDAIERGDTETARGLCELLRSSAHRMRQEPETA